MKLMKKVLTIFLAVFISLVLTKGIGAQGTGDTGGDTSTGTQLPSAEEPQASQAPADFPTYIVRPQESINPFGKSTMGSGVFEKDFEREEKSTLGVQNKRRSNVELNQPPPKAGQALVDEGEEAAGETGEAVGVGEETEGVEAAEETFGAAPTEEGTTEEASSKSPTSTRKIGSVYRWVDENGVMHFTNNVGSVPEQYINQIINQGEGKKEEKEEIEE